MSSVAIVGTVKGAALLLRDREGLRLLTDGLLFKGWRVTAATV